MKSKLFKAVATTMMTAALLVGSMVQGTTSKVMAATAANVIYRAHVACEGWHNPVSNGSTAGTTGKSRAIESVSMSVNGMSGGIEYQVHQAAHGWEGYVRDGANAGYTGQGLQLEAIMIRLYGDIANYYDVLYRTHCQNIGWTEWVSNGQVSGTTGQGLRMEAYEVKLVPKNNQSFDPIWPCDYYTITTLYKYSSGAAHSTRFKYGIDIGAPKNANVYAVEAGKVITSEYSTSSGFGNWIMIQHDNGKVSLYAHLNSRNVSVGQSVSKGQVIGKVGNTSAKYSINPHLHFELGNSNTSKAAGDPWAEYYKAKYGNKMTITCNQSK